MGEAGKCQISLRLLQQKMITVTGVTTEATKKLQIIVQSTEYSIFTGRFGNRVRQFYKLTKFSQSNTKKTE